MATLFYCAITLFTWALFVYTFTIDRSRYRNSLILSAAILFTLITITFLAGPYQRQVVSVILITVSILLILVPFFLVHNGIVMIRREGARLPNLLSLGMGLMIGLGEVATFFIAFGDLFFDRDFVAKPEYNIISAISLVISVSVVYLSLSFLIFMIYSLFLQIIPRKKDFDFLIIHGAGLLHGDQMSKLLKDRTDKAIDVYQKDPTPPVMIPSGGQGADETISEAEAIGRYLVEQGIPQEKIILEDKSVSTMENLKNSKAIIDRAQGTKYTALVTSNYHVYRALRYCRRIGMDCTGIGSRVALYYWPSALIREFIAIHAEKKHFIYLVGGWVLMMIPTVLHIINNWH